MTEEGRPNPGLSESLGRLDEVTRTLRAECPWDREQDARSIVPHTVEEAYELAEAVAEEDDPAIRDELGDVLFQVVFLALLMEERGEGDLASIADQLTEKLIRRHPHVYPPGEGDDGTGDGDRNGNHPGEQDGDRPTGSGIETAEDVRRQWDVIKRDVEGRSSSRDWRKPGLPALIYATKVQWKLDPSDRPANASAENPDLGSDEEEIGEAIWETVERARRLGVDPELALRRVAESHAARIHGQE